ncbi:MAG: hypothetical protein OHK0038_27880 [Flammeovirgaceae bacterium]
MKVKLTKIIELSSAQAYLRFQKEEERKDIQEYLNGKKRFEPLIENRIKDYLKNIGVFDENYLLTIYGYYTVKETGKMLVSEEGKYQIWFTQKDSFLKTTIVYFRRLQPNADKEELKPLNLEFEETGHLLLPTSDNSFTKIILKNNKNLVGKTDEQKDTLHFSWIWENLDKSHYIFSGQLEKSNRQTNIKSEAIPCNINIQDWITKILPDWNIQQKRYSIRFDNLKEESRKTFEDKNFVSRWNDFEVQIQNLPLMPYDIEEAKKWRDWLLNEELEKDYFSIGDFEATASEINEKVALSAYNLDIPKAKDFIAKRNSKKVFWHLQAPMDLNPNTKIKLSSKPIELRQDEKISFAEIVAKLGLYDSSLVIYYDRYVITEKQQRAVVAFLQSIESKNKIVITNIKQNSSKYIQKEKPEIKLKDLKTIFKDHSPHDRYLIISNKDEIQVWNISNSIDYIRFSDKNIDANTFGTIRQSVVFTPVNKELLNKELLNFLENEIKNGN